MAKLNIQFFIKDEAKGIKEYQKAEKQNPKAVYKKILPQEKHHLMWLKQVMKKTKLKKENLKSKEEKGENKKVRAKEAKTGIEAKVAKYHATKGKM